MSGWDDFKRNENANPFTASSSRFIDEVAERMALVDRAIPFHVSYLDDVCRAIMPHDLVMIGARTGAGKTSLALQIAGENAAAGRRVHYIALEGEKHEIERRLKYRSLCRLAFQHRLDGRDRLNYAEWYLGRLGGILGQFEAQVVDELRQRYQTLSTLYREKDFTLTDIKRVFGRIKGETDLVVLDHLHYVDTNPDESENRAVKDIVKALADLSLNLGVPVIVIAHLRKRQTRKELVPELEEFHGGSDITKIATRAIMLSRAYDRPDLVTPEGKAVPGVAMTYMTVVKDRALGITNTVALIGFQLSRQRYLEKYQLGRMSVMGDEWSPVEFTKKPSWATHMIPTYEVAQ